MLDKNEYATDYGSRRLPCPDSTARRHVEGCHTGITGYYDEGTGTSRIVLEADKLYVGGNQPVWSPRPVPVATQLERLPDGIVYLGSPYSKQPDFDEAAGLAEQAAARLMRRGLTVYCPIAHGHTIAAYGLPTHWDFWRRQCDPFIDAASALVVLKLDGWRNSVGLTYEIARFHEAGKPIVYVTMEELG